MSRAERRFRTDLVIKRRWAALCQHSDPDGQIMTGHRLAKNEAMGSCGNKGCQICTAEHEWKRLNKKRERMAGRRAEQEDVA